MDNNSGLNTKFRMQIDLQQTNENLRLVRNEITKLNIQIRKYKQDYSRIKLTLSDAEANLKTLKEKEINLNQDYLRQKRALIARR